MKYFLVIALFGVGIIVGICNAACFNTGPKARRGREPEGCDLNGKIYKYGSSWRTRDCMDCSCSTDGSLHCCQVGGRPVKYDKEKCTVIFDKDNCKYHVVRNDDPCKTCPHSSVG
ncbi:hypothetical protein GDO81_004359 [Engystomops pustulosus]|uniref:Beta-microseminoprotein n=1 Tax=Engystomops pustulosus TaxID=76066 RepID=A0AAV6ZU18_ENGPU|nr:hypothetical protein GDO81_004359 [Engystomops pustulosus]